MQKLEIKGGRKISGTIVISGSKNATLPILASTILTNKKITIKNIPIVKDVETMAQLLSTLGSNVKLNQKRKTIEILNKKSLKTFAPYHLLKTMRAGVLVLGPLLAKYKIAKVALPGGCAIGSRPIDLHLNALKKMGARIKIRDGYVLASAKRGLKGCTIKFPKISVGATENILIAACFAKGKTVIRDAEDLRNKESDRISVTVRELNGLGAKLEELTDGISIEGKGYINGGTGNSHGDHRLAMTLGIAGLLSQDGVVVEGSNVVDISYPDFGMIWIW